MLRTRARCAIKLVEAATPSQKRQIESEVAILQTRAAGLPFVPYIYGAWEYGANIYIVMEFIDGTILDPDRWQDGYWHPHRVERFLAVMLKQLDQLHARGIIHRDLNPSNIMRTKDKQYKLLDFGIAKPDIRAQTIVHGGTLIYSPIEQLRGERTTVSSDLYSLGVVAYHLLTGAPPADAIHRLSGEQVERPGAYLVNVSPDLDRTIMAMIELYADDRPHSASAALALLENRQVTRPAGRFAARPVPQRGAPPARGLDVFAPPRRPLAPIGPPAFQRRVPVTRHAAPIGLPDITIPVARPARRSRASGVLRALLALLLVAGLLWIFATEYRRIPLAQTIATPVPSVQPLAASWRGRIAFSSKRGSTYHLFIFDQRTNALTMLTNSNRDDYVPVWSPDGGLLLFVGSANGNDDIYRIRSDGTDLRRLTINPAIDGMPVWSPDGTQIAFVSSRAGNAEIYVMNADGSQLERITTNDGADLSPAWLADGRVVFISQRRGGWGLYSIPATGGRPAPLWASEHTIRFPAVSPDQQRLAFEMEANGNWDIYTILLAGGKPLRLTTNPAEESHPSWSPDSQQIMFMSTRDATPLDPQRAQLYVMRADGSDEQRVLEDDFDNRHPAWAPDK